MPVELLHYAGQFHGFLNFDAVIGAGRDALQRIGDALAAAFSGESIADRTVEISDAESARPSSLYAAAGELTAAGLMTWVATERWSGTLLRQLSPTAAGTTRVLLQPLCLPVSLMRRRLVTRLDQRVACQTYPKT
ncbi:hypothetical protein D3C77_411350 [compost metagenome]